MKKFPAFHPFLKKSVRENKIFAIWTGLVLGRKELAIMFSQPQKVNRQYEHDNTLSEYVCDKL